MAIQIETIDRLLRKRGYTVVTETLKKRCFQWGSNAPIYLNLATNSGKTALVLHPQTKSIEALRRIPGLTIGDEYYHSSNMRLFPKRKWQGENESPYGWGVTFESEIALASLLTAVE